MELPGLVSTEIKKVIVYVSDRKFIIGKFLLVSGSAVLLNLLLLFLMIKYMGFNTQVGENVANAVSMELSIIYNFFMSRAITWRERYKEKRGKLFMQILKFQITIGITILFRIVLFPLLQLWGIFYLLNAAVGIALASVFNFIIYDTLIFKRGRAGNV